MIWLSWRQFRVQAVAGTVAVLLAAAYLFCLGVQIRHSHDSYLDRCRPQGDCVQGMGQFVDGYTNLLLVIDGLFLLVPLVFGLFWGAPLVARELETGTHRLVWNQSITRRRWLAVKLLFVGAATAITTGLLSLLTTWAASPVDRIADDRFGTLVFGARNIAPVAYAIFAVVLGTVVGTLLRRTVPTMALTLLLVAVVQILVPNLVRPHLMTPVTVEKPMTAEAINEARNLGGLRNRPTVGGLTIPDAWITDTSELLTANGEPLAVDRFNACLSMPPGSPGDGVGRFGAAAHCLGALNLHLRLSYQPNHRYWPFQWLESALYLAGTLLLALYGIRRVQRRLT